MIVTLHDTIITEHWTECTSGQKLWWTDECGNCVPECKNNIWLIKHWDTYHSDVCH